MGHCDRARGPAQAVTAAALCNLKFSLSGHTVPRTDYSELQLPLAVAHWQADPVIPGRCLSVRAKPPNSESKPPAVNNRDRAQSQQATKCQCTRTAPPPGRPIKHADIQVA